MWKVWNSGLKLSGHLSSPSKALKQHLSWTKKVIPLKFLRWPRGIFTLSFRKKQDLHSTVNVYHVARIYESMRRQGSALFEWPFVFVTKVDEKSWKKVWKENCIICHQSKVFNCLLCFFPEFASSAPQFGGWRYKSRLYNTNNTTPTTQHRPSGVRTPPFQCWKGSARSLSSWLDRCSDAKAMKIALIEGAKGKKDRSADAYLQYNCQNLPHR